MVRNASQDQNGERCSQDRRNNPCRPAPKAPETKDCECPPIAGVPSQPRKPPERPRPRPENCCDEILRILRDREDLPPPHKPKAPPGRKAGRLCETLGIKDRILPVLEMLWERQNQGQPGRNDFEQKAMAVFAQLDQEQREALQAGFDGYRQIRRRGRNDCLFDDCLVDAANSDGKGVEGSWFLEEFLGEGLVLAAKKMFPNSEGKMGPGQIRLWDNISVKGPNGSSATVYVGPWPWLTSVVTNEPDQEFGSARSFRPVPGQTHQWLNEQYDVECAFVPSTGGAINASCSRKTPPPPPPPAPGEFGGFNPKSCKGGLDYIVGGECLKIPMLMPGASFRLRGFNWITETVKAHFSSVDDPGLKFVVEANVWGDVLTPAKDADGHSIVDERVFDGIDVSLPDRDPRNVTNKLPPGLYSVRIEVANITNAIFDGNTAASLFSNELLIELGPDPNRKYQFWSTGGRCNRETPGWGDDEIWWDAFTGHIVVTDVAVGLGEPTPVELRPLERRSFPRGPWEDMDSGDVVNSRFDIFGPKAFERGGVVAIALVGFEVDSESAARKQLKTFGEAYWQALKDILGIALAGEGLVGALANLAKVTLSQALVAMAIVAAIVLIALVFWSMWAPADMIALDLIALDTASSWAKTDAKLPIPGPSVRTYQGDHEVLVTVTEIPTQSPNVKAGDQAKPWTQTNRYDTPEDGEDSSYELYFTLART
nr:hypothetical protein [Paracoccus saliphilus]